MVGLNLKSCNVSRQNWRRCQIAVVFYGRTMNEKLPSGKQSIVGRRGRPVRDRSCVVIVLSMQSRLLLSPVQITFRHVPDYPDADEIISV